MAPADAPPAPRGCLPRAAATALAVCVAYGAASMGLSLLNKALLGSYRFGGLFFLLGCQMLVSLGVCLASRDLAGNPFRVPAFSWPLLRAGALMGALYVGNVLAGMVGLRLVSVPLFLCIRRLTPACILALDYALHRKTADGSTQLAVAISVVGTVVAGYESLSADWAGFLVTLANNVVTALLAMQQKRFSEDPAAQAAAAAIPTSEPRQPSGDPAALPPAAPPAAPPAKLSVFGILYVNALVATPLAFALSAATGELAYVASFPHLRDPGFLAGFATSASMGVVLTYTAVLCTTHVSPIGYSMTGNFKDVAATVLGWALFGGFAATPASVGGLLLSFCGAGVFAYAGLRHSRGAAAAAAHAPAAGAAAVAPEAALGSAAAKVGGVVAAGGDEARGEDADDAANEGEPLVVARQRGVAR